MDMHMDPRNATREELLAAVLEDLSHRIILSDAQMAAWESSDTAHLAALVVIGQAQEDVAPGERQAVVDGLRDRGVIVWAGTATLGGWHLA